MFLLRELLDHLRSTFSAPVTDPTAQTIFDGRPNETEEAVEHDDLDWALLVAQFPL